MDSITSHNLIGSLLRDGEEVAFRAGGPSMTPVIRDGDLVQIRPIRPGDFRPGAVLLYPVNGRFVLHRLTKSNRRSRICITAGDAPWCRTETVVLDQVIGVAQWCRRGRRKIRLDTPLARLCGRVRFALRPLLRAAHRLYRLIRPKG